LRRRSNVRSNAFGWSSFVSRRIDIRGVLDRISLRETPFFEEQAVGIIFDASDAPMKRRQVNVLIIEDQQFDVELILRALYLHTPDLTAAVAPTGAAAIEYLDTHSPRVILLDLNLPDIDGCELLKKIREDSRFRTIPVIVLTGSSTDRQRNEAYRFGISGYISKTPDLHTLSDHLVLFKHLLQKSTTASAPQ
jgi:CheY-like chemotaxis protein